jgi:hypothetical protein
MPRAFMLGPALIGASRKIAIIDRPGALEIARAHRGGPTAFRRTFNVTHSRMNRARAWRFRSPGLSLFCRLAHISGGCAIGAMSAQIIEHQARKKQQRDHAEHGPWSAAFVGTFDIVAHGNLQTRDALLNAQVTLGVRS